MDKIVVLASGNGSNLQAILDACERGELNAQVAVVFSDQPEAYALERARQSGVPAVLFPWLPYKQAGRTRQEYDADLAARIAGFHPSLIVLAGWMRLLSAAFLDCFPGQVLNLHPALPGTFPGTHAISRAWEAFQAGKIQETGVMVHFVPDEGVDDGPMIACEIVPIIPTDSLESLEARIHQVEHRLLVSAIRKVLEL
jgi:formyltetrahydrofolate-dependent phosphoribosylglycinamide formyltransferase